MLINLVVFLLSIPIYILSLLGSAVGAIMPPWMTQTIYQVMGGTGVLNTVFPMYPHEGMAGLAGQIGIMSIFGWFLTLMGYMMILSLSLKLIRLFFGILPWNTSGVKIATGYDEGSGRQLYG